MYIFNLLIPLKPFKIKIQDGRIEFCLSRTQALGALFFELDIQKEDLWFLCDMTTPDLRTLFRFIVSEYSNLMILAPHPHFGAPLETVAVAPPAPPATTPLSITMDLKS